MKIKIDKDEWHPVYYIADDKYSKYLQSQEPFEVSTEFYEEYKRIHKEFDEMQMKLEDFYEERYGKR